MGHARAQKEHASYINDVPYGLTPRRGRHLSGQELDGGLAPWDLVALRFDGLPMVVVPPFACRRGKSPECMGGGRERAAPHPMLACKALSMYYLIHQFSSLHLEL